MVIAGRAAAVVVVVLVLVRQFPISDFKSDSERRIIQIRIRGRLDSDSNLNFTVVFLVEFRHKVVDPRV